jgi:hypothetical protein
MENEDLKNYKLAIYLLKDSVLDYKDAIKEKARFKEYDFNEKIKVKGKVLIGLTKEKGYFGCTGRRRLHFGARVKRGGCKKEFNHRKIAPGNGQKGKKIA